MGNICSKSANETDNFSTPGRVLGSNADNNRQTTSTVPKKITSTTPGRTLGSRDGGSSPDNARGAAAKAAEERANKSNQTGGKLSQQLAAQKKQTQGQTLAAGSEEVRGHRDADANEEARNWN